MFVPSHRPNMIMPYENQLSTRVLMMLTQQINPNLFFQLLSALPTVLCRWQWPDLGNDNSNSAAMQAEAPKEAAAAAALRVRQVGAEGNHRPLREKCVI